MIRGFSKNGPYKSSMLFFAEMHRHNARPNHLTYPFVLKSCSCISAEIEGEQIHAQILKTGFLSDVYVGNGVIGVYVNCGRVEEARLMYDEMRGLDVVSHTLMINGYFAVGDLVSARLLFDAVGGPADVVLWSAMISGYAKNGDSNEALKLFEEMQSLGLRPNSITMVSVISACTQLGDFGRGKWIHDFMVKSGIEMNMVVCTSLLDMHTKNGSVDEARKLFDMMPTRDVVSWNSLINSYAKNGYAYEALEAFKEMQDLGMEPNKVTFLSVLSSCAQIGALEKGREMDCLAKKMGIGSDLSVGTALLDMYAKSGSLADAHRVFDRISPRDVIVWSAMINGYAMNGLSDEAISLFRRMLEEGIYPNEVTYVCVLTACSHGGLVDEGFELFYSMARDHRIEPRMEHYACMVDLLGRAGLLHEAKSFVDSMPFVPSASVWGCLLGACVTHKNIEIGKYAARKLFRLEPMNDQNYVLLSNIYADASRWEDVENIRMTMKCMGTKKSPGCSWIEIGDEIYEFLVEDRMHPSHPQIYEILDSLCR
ncbi:hypothetical protein AAC387_Pa05g1696 [Persea americana]